MLLLTILFAVIAACIYSIFSIEPLGPIAIDPKNNITYQGVSSNGVDSFLNIRFGQSTGGIGRFAPPKPFIQSHNSIVDATLSGPICPQSLTVFGVNTNVNTSQISEDCLNLRISRPSAVGAGAKLPVLAFIYGG
jgi:carboxylesterase type B